MLIQRCSSPHHLLTPRAFEVDERGGGGGGGRGGEEVEEEKKQ